MTEPAETCANCDRKIGRLEKPYDWQGQTVCIECYERLRRASRADTEQATAEAAAAEADTIRWSASPSVIGYLFLYFILCLMAVASLVAAYWVLPIALLAVASLTVIVAEEIGRRSVRFSIIGNRLVLDRGILAKSHNEIRIQDIRELTCAQSLLGRILGFGTITADTAAHDGAEIRMENIPRPRKVVDMINSLRK
jgi:uncharacterized membrane protein YdbT with pleckstrin-like domain